MPRSKKIPVKFGFINSKGGEGKSTTVVITLCKLSELTPNLRILLVDLDAQNSLHKF